MNRFLEGIITPPFRGGVIPSCGYGNDCPLVGDEYGDWETSGRLNYCQYHFASVGRAVAGSGNKKFRKHFYRLYYYKSEDGLSYLYNFGTLCNRNKANEYDFTPRPPTIGDFFAPQYDDNFASTTSKIYIGGEISPTYPQGLIDFFIKLQNLRRSIALLKKASQSVGDLSGLISSLVDRALEEEATSYKNKYDTEIDPAKYINIFAGFDLSVNEAMRKAINMLSTIKRELIFAYNQDNPFEKKYSGKMAGEDHYHPLNAFWENGENKGVYRSFEFERERFYQRQAGESKYSAFNSYEISNGLK